MAAAPGRSASLCSAWVHLVMLRSRAGDSASPGYAAASVSGDHHHLCPSPSSENVAIHCCDQEVPQGVDVSKVILNWL